MTEHHMIIDVDDYRKYVGAEMVERVIEKAEQVNDLHVAHVNSTYYGGGWCGGGSFPFYAPYERRGY